MTKKQANTKRFAYFWAWLIPNIATPLALTEMTFGIIQGTATVQTQWTFAGLLTIGLVGGGIISTLRKAGKLSNNEVIRIVTSSTGVPITLWAISLVLMALKSNIDAILTVLMGTAGMQTASLVLLAKHTKYRDIVTAYENKNKGNEIVEL